MMKPFAGGIAAGLAGGFVWGGWAVVAGFMGVWGDRRAPDVLVSARNWNQGRWAWQRNSGEQSGSCSFVCGKSNHPPISHCSSRQCRARQPGGASIEAVARTPDDETGDAHATLLLATTAADPRLLMVIPVCSALRLSGSNQTQQNSPEVRCAKNEKTGETEIKRRAPNRPGQAHPTGPKHRHNRPIEVSPCAYEPPSISAGEANRHRLDRSTPTIRRRRIGPVRPARRTFRRIHRPALAYPRGSIIDAFRVGGSFCPHCLSSILFHDYWPLVFS